MDEENLCTSRVMVSVNVLNTDWRLPGVLLAQHCTAQMIQNILGYM